MFRKEILLYSYILSITKPIEVIKIRQPIKILAIADLHNYTTEEMLQKISKQHYDICVLLGDIGESAMKQLVSVLNKEKTYGVLGNHDSFDLYKKFGIKELNFQDTLTVSGKLGSDVSIKGLSGSARYKAGDFPMLTQEESEQVCSHKHGDCDIMFSHDYPYKFYHSSKSGCWSSHTGLQGIKNYLQSVNCPKLLVHGHLHKNTKRVYSRGIGYRKKGSPVIIGVYGCVMIDYLTLTVREIFVP